MRGKKFTIIALILLFFSIFGVAGYQIVHATSSNSQTVIQSQSSLSSSVSTASQSQPSSSVTSSQAQKTVETDNNLSDYTSYVREPQNVFNNYQVVLNAGVQAIFYVAKCIYWFTDWIQQHLTYDVIGNFATPIFAAASQIFWGFFKGDVLYLMALGLIISFMIAMARGTFGRTFARVCLSLFVTTLFFTLGGSITNKVNHEIESINTSSLTSLSVNGVTSANKMNMRDLMLVQPFLKMNFDNESQYSYAGQLLEVNSITDGAPVRDLSNVMSGAGNNDEHLNFISIGDKFSTASGAVINNAFIGVVTVGLTVAKFVMQIVFLMLVVIGVAAGILSFFPQFENSIFNLAKKALGVLIVSALLGISLSLFIFYNNLLDFLFSKMGFTSYFGVAILKLAISYLIWKNRSGILSVFQGANVKLSNTDLAVKARNAFSRGRQSLAPVVAGAGALGFAGGRMFMDRQRQQNTASQTKRFQKALDLKRHGSTDEERQKGAQEADRLEKKLDYKEQKAAGVVGFRNRLNHFRSNYDRNYSSNEKLEGRNRRLGQTNRPYTEFKEATRKQSLLEKVNGAALPKNFLGRLHFVKKFNSKQPERPKSPTKPKNLNLNRPKSHSVPSSVNRKNSNVVGGKNRQGNVVQRLSRELRLTKPGNHPESPKRKPPIVTPAQGRLLHLKKKK